MAVSPTRPRRGSGSSVQHANSEGSRRASLAVPNSEAGPRRASLAPDSDNQAERTHAERAQRRPSIAPESDGPTEQSQRLASMLPEVGIHSTRIIPARRGSVVASTAVIPDFAGRDGQSQSLRRRRGSTNPTPISSGTPGSSSKNLLNRQEPVIKDVNSNANTNTAVYTTSTNNSNSTAINTNNNTNTSATNSSNSTSASNKSQESSEIVVGLGGPRERSLGRNRSISAPPVPPHMKAPFHRVSFIIFFLSFVFLMVGFL